MKRSLLIAAVVLVAGAISAAVAWRLYIDRWGERVIEVATPTTVILEPGQSVTEFARHMHRRELIDLHGLTQAVAHQRLPLDETADDVELFERRVGSIRLRAEPAHVVDEWRRSRW